LQNEEKKEKTWEEKKGCTQMVLGINSEEEEHLKLFGSREN